MNSTSTDSILSNIREYYIVCGVSGGFGLLSVVMSISIIVIVRHAKTRLHTVRYLLMCNTCIASVLYCIAQTVNFTFLIFLPWETSDVGCQWRGYFGYASISAVIYSYLFQALSRLFFSKFSAKYPSLTTFKTHYYLIAANWIIVIVIPLPSVITNDIYFRPGLLCWVPLKRTIHVAYTVFAYYCIPVFSIIIIYISIYRKVKQATKRVEMMLTSTHDKRDLEVFRNILILLFIYIAGGVPTLIFIMSTIDFFYLAGIITFTAAVTIEKVCTILLDRELRHVVCNMVNSRNRVMPFENTLTHTRYL